MLRPIKLYIINSHCFRFKSSRYRQSTTTITTSITFTDALHLQ